MVGEHVLPAKKRARPMMAVGLVSLGKTSQVSPVSSIRTYVR